MSRSANIYSHSREQAWKAFAPHLSGDKSGLFAVVCTSQLSPASRTALEKTAVALGYAKDSPTFACIDAGNDALEPARLFQLVEALDPLCIVLAGEDAAGMFAQAYRVELPSQPAFRVFGREVRAIAHMDELMENSAGKQQAWAVLKTLPHVEGR